MSYRTFFGESVDAPIYDKAIDEDDHVMPVSEFIVSCRNGYLMDHDGWGHPAKDGKASDVIISPSDIKGGIPSDATHIVWYNK